MEDLVMDACKYDGRGPKAFLIVDLNMSTKEMFGKHTPKTGRRYALKCVAFNGKRAYFNLEIL